MSGVGVGVVADLRESVERVWRTGRRLGLLDLETSPRRKLRELALLAERERKKARKKR